MSSIHPENRHKAILITGASTGIGQACALHLDRLGFTVYAGVRTEKDADSLDKQGSERLIPVFLDITDPGSIQVAGQDLSDDLKEHGLYGLVNNAGIVVAGPLEYLPLPELRKQFEINVFGQMAVTQKFLPLLRQGQASFGDARIVNMSSISGRSALPYAGAYSASKHALEALSDSLRLELAPWGIKVSIIEPGAVITPLWDKSETKAKAIFKKISAKGNQLYGPIMERVQHHANESQKKGMTPEEVTKATTHALTAKSPKIRYLVGQDAQLRTWINRLPDALKDKIIRQFI